jgi:hypothetical protein
MRRYAKIRPEFWSNTTGRMLKSAGSDVLLLALYLRTCPAANMIGLYYLPLPTLCHESGLTPRSATEALERLATLDFAYYDAIREMVWVLAMAEEEIGGQLRPLDKRVKGIESLLAPFVESPFYDLFYERYGRAYSLKWQGPEKDHRRTMQAPSKPGTGTGSGTGTETGTGTDRRECEGGKIRPNGKANDSG